MFSQKIMIKSTYLNVEKSFNQPVFLKETLNHEGVQE